MFVTDDDQFERALDRVRQLLSMRSMQSDGEPNQHSGSTATPDYLDRIIVRAGQSLRTLKTASIDRVEAGENYIRLSSKGKSYMLRMMLKDIERRLNPAQFVRISKSIVINLDSVVEIRKLCHSDFEVVLSDCASVRLSRRYRDRFVPQLA